jgi:hypothetical protein
MDRNGHNKLGTRFLWSKKHAGLQATIVENDLYDILWIFDSFSTPDDQVRRNSSRFQSFPAGQEFPVISKDGVSWWTDHEKWLRQDVWDRLSRHADAAVLRFAPSPDCPKLSARSPSLSLMSSPCQKQWFAIEAVAEA